MQLVFSEEQSCSSILPSFIQKLVSLLLPHYFPSPPPMQYIVASFLNGILKDFFFPVLCAIAMCTDKRTV